MIKLKKKTCISISIYETVTLSFNTYEIFHKIFQSFINKHEDVDKNMERCRFYFKSNNKLNIRCYRCETVMIQEEHIYGLGHRIG